MSNTTIHTDEENRLHSLYRSAGDLEIALQNTAHRDPNSALTAAQVGVFNQLLRSSRDLVPTSVALKEDVEEIDQTVKAADAYQALHVTLVPVLHNALPDDYADR